MWHLETNDPKVEIIISEIAITGTRLYYTRRGLPFADLPHPHLRGLRYAIYVDADLAKQERTYEQKKHKNEDRKHECPFASVLVLLHFQCPRMETNSRENSVPLRLALGADVLLHRPDPSLLLNP